MLYRKTAAAFIALLMISIVVFFLTLNSVAISMSCLIIIFIAVIGIRISLGKMDEFKSLYVNTVPMIDPEKEYNEEQLESQTDALIMEFEEEVTTLMEQFVVDVDQAQLMTEMLVEEVCKEEASITDSLNEEMVSTQLPLDQQVIEIAVETEDDSVVGIEEKMPHSSFVEEMAKEEIGVDLVVEDLLAEANEIDSVEKLIDDHQQKEQIIPLVQSISVASEGNEQIEALPIEEQIVIKMTELLNHHQKDTSILTSKMVGNYFTFYVGKRILCRLKLTGRKQYVLTQLNEESVKQLNLQYEAPSKSESYQSRVAFTDLSVLEVLSDHLIELYERCV